MPGNQAVIYNHPVSRSTRRVSQSIGFLHTYLLTLTFVWRVGWLLACLLGWLEAGKIAYSLSRCKKGYTTGSSKSVEKCNRQRLPALTNRLGLLAVVWLLTADVDCPSNNTFPVQQAPPAARLLPLNT